MMLGTAARGLIMGASEDRQDPDDGTPRDTSDATADDRRSCRLTPERADHWARKQSWTQIEARRLARNYDPTLYRRRDKTPQIRRSPDLGTAVRARPLGKKPNLKEQMRRALRRNIIEKNPTPLEFISWLDRISYPSPDHLRKAVLRHNVEADNLRAQFEALIDRLSEEGLVSARGRRQILKQIGPHGGSAPKADESSYHRQERKRLYSFVAAFAEQNGYKTDGPTKGLEVLIKVLEDLGLKGISPLTMRKYLGEAYSIHGSRPQKHKRS